MRNPAAVIARVVIAIFLLIVFLPTVQQLFHPIPVAPVVESRQKVALPPGNPLVELWRGGPYFSNYERHYNDVFGLRDFFIRLRNQIQLSLFHDSDQVIIGRNGWIVDKPSVEVDEQTADHLPDDQWAQLERRMKKLQLVLQRRGVALLVVPVPFKNTVYPEYFPESSARRPTPNGYQRYRSLLKSAHVPFVDAYAILSKHRSEGVFYKTDIHWNYLGARYVAQEVVATLAKRLNAAVRWRYPMDVTDQAFQDGDESSTLAVFWPPPDVEKAAFQPGDECGATMPATAVQPAHFVNQCRGPKLPKMQMFGNSYMLEMAAVGLQDHFAEVYRTYDIQNFRNLLHEIRPGTKILVWQNFELEIGYQLQSSDFWKDVDAARL